jgi:cytochrome c peroxidase
VGACSACHLIEEEYALFSDDKLHNTGLGYQVSMGIEPKTTRVQLAPGVFADLDTSVIRAVSRPKINDLGLYEITENPDDRWKFRTPSLRNVALTAPYMHDGSMQNLREVVEFYNQGGVPNEVLSPLIKPLALSDAEIDDVVAFLESLTGGNVAVLVADAFAAPIGDISTDDPN